MLKRVVPENLRPYLLPVKSHVASLPARAQKHRLLASRSLSTSDRRLLARASGRVHPQDTMYKGDGDHYFRVGLSAIHCLERALERTDTVQVDSILALPCGWGRVLRLIRARFPAARLTACDLAPGAVDFCTREFGAEPAHSSPDFEAVSLGARFDLIWCGSLITHLDEPGIVALLRLFRRHLAPAGLAVFTAHGDRLPRLLGEYSRPFGLEDRQVAQIAADHAVSGFAYADYPGERKLGISVTSPAWLRDRVEEVGGLRESYFEARAWGAVGPRDGYHDLYALTLHGESQ